MSSPCRLLGLLVLSVVCNLACNGSQNEQVLAYLPEPVLRPREARPAPPPVRAVHQQARRTPAPTRFPRSTALPAGVDPVGGIRRQWRYIVIHHSATAVGGAARFHHTHKYENGWDELGYHFVVGNGSDTPDGYVEVGPRWWKQKHGAHCKTPNNEYNDQGIGICLVGNFEQGYASEAQMRSLEALVARLMRTCHIPLSNIKTHGGITHKTACPGRHFSLAALKQRLSAQAAR